VVPAGGAAGRAVGRSGHHRRGRTVGRSGGPRVAGRRPSRTGRPGAGPRRSGRGGPGRTCAGPYGPGCGYPTHRRRGSAPAAGRRKGVITMEDLRSRIAAELARSRARTTALADAVDDADLVRQHSPLMSPLVWDVAHVGNQEELWLVRDVGGREPIRQDIDHLYDAF